jgi:hypothetical protein
MKRVLRDHGQILHWTGGHHYFPVRGASEADLGFAQHGALEGRTAIGWHQFFPPFDLAEKVLVVDDEDGSLEILTESEAFAKLGDAARPPGFLDKVRHALGSRGGDATQQPKDGAA